jgi:hypothetical protein
VGSGTQDDGVRGSRARRRVRARVIPNSSGPTFRKIVTETVDAGSILYTDDRGYTTLGDTYTHRTIRHRDRIYADGHTQTIEGFFGGVKNAIRGVYHGVSSQWLQGYLNEWPSLPGGSFPWPSARSAFRA